MKRALYFVSGLSLALPAVAQTRHLVTDRTADAIYSLWDLNGNGLIDEPAELSVYFDATNMGGTPLPTTMGALAARPDGLVVAGSSGTDAIFSMRDWNRDGDALDPLESRIAADASNAAGLLFGAPSGLAFDAQGRLYATNAGNTGGPDAVYRLVDLNGDDDFQDQDEAAYFIGEPFFGPGNGLYGPHQIAIAATLPTVVGYFRNATADLHGVYRFEDANGNGRADDAGEVTVFFDATNLSGIVVGPGLPLTLDAARPGQIYTLQAGAGGDELYRIADTNSDLDAQDAGEAILVFSTTESGFSATDLASLPSGQVLIADTSGNRVIILTDLDQDGLFSGSAERATYFSNSALAMSDVRHIAQATPVCQANCDLSTASPALNVADFSCFLQAFAAGSPYANCDSSASEPILNVADFSCFLQAFAAGCP